MSLSVKTKRFALCRCIADESGGKVEDVGESRALSLNAHLTHTHSRPQRPRSFWSAPRIATSGQVQHRKSTIHGLPVTLRMLRVKSDKSDWFWFQSIVFTKAFKNRMSLVQARGRDSWCLPKGARLLGTRMTHTWIVASNFQIRSKARPTPSTPPTTPRMTASASASLGQTDE